MSTEKQEGLVLKRIYSETALNVCLLGKFQVSSIILAGFRKGMGGWW